MTRSDSVKENSRKRALLFSALSIHVANNGAEWTSTDLPIRDIEPKARAFLRREAQAVRDSLQLTVEGSCEDGRAFLLDGELRARDLYEPRPFIVRCLCALADSLPEPEASERRDLAAAIVGGPLPVARKELGDVGARDLHDQRAAWERRTAPRDASRKRSGMGGYESESNKQPKGGSEDEYEAGQ